MAKKSQTPEEKLAAALVPEEDWPYELPEGWCWVRILSTFINETDSKRKIKTKDYLPQGLIPVVDQGKDLVGGFTDDRSMAFQGDLPVIIFGDHTRCVKYVDFIFAQGADGIKVLRPRRYLLPVFFFYAMCNLNIPNLGYRRHFPLFDKFMIPLPPIKEQKHIIDHIKDLFAKLDAAKSKVESALAATATRKAAILHAAFTGELTGTWRQENGVTDDTWKKISLKEACEKITDGTHHSPPNTDQGEYMYVTAKNIKESGIDLSNITYVSKEVHEEIYARCDVKKGDVLYIKDGATTGIATVNMMEEPFSLLSSVAVLRPRKDKLIAGYLKNYLNSSEVKAMMINNMSGNAITRLTLTKIKATNIKVCSIDEQREIVRILDTVLAREQRVTAAAEKILADIDLMKKSVLARAFRGELGTGNPSDVSAVTELREYFSRETAK